MGRLGYSSGHRAITGARSPRARGSGCGRPPPLPNTDPSFPIPGSPHLNFGGTRATKLSADLERTPAPAAHGAPGEEREGGGEGEGAGLPGGPREGRGPTPTGSASRPSRHGRREAEGEGRGGERRSALGTAAVRSAPVARRARGQSRSRVAAAGPRRGGGESLQHLPLLPLPAAQIKKQQKATNHPGAQRLAARRAEDSACGARTQQATRMARHKLGRGAGLSGARLSSSGSARTPALAAASTSQLRLRRLCRRAARPPGQKLRTLPGGCRQNPDRTSGSLTPPPSTSDSLPPPAASLPEQLWPLGRRRL